MSRDFKPSPQSLSPAERTAATLRYLCRAAEAIEKHLEEEGDVPHWVVDRITQSAQQLGMAVSYVSFAQERKFQRAEEDEKNKKKPKKPRTRKKSP